MRRCACRPAKLREAELQILVTGACTPLGQTLLRALVARDTLLGALGAAVRVERIIAVDRTQPARLFVEPRIEYVCGNFEHSRFLARVMGTATDSIFHLSSLGAAAGIGGALQDLDDALMRSLDTTRALVDACQFQSAQPRLVLASTAAARGAGAAPPATADGICNGMCELFLIECARRAYIDLRGVRLPPLAGSPAPDASVVPLGAGQAPAMVPPAEPAAVSGVTLDAAAQALLAAHEQPRVFPGPAPFTEVAATGGAGEGGDAGS